MNRTMLTRIAFAALAMLIPIGVWASLGGGTTTFSGLVQITDLPDSVPTWDTVSATSGSDLGIEGELEVDGNTDLDGTLNIAGILTCQTAVTLSDGATIDQSANNVVTIAENSEDIELTFGSNLVTVASTTGATVTFTPAVTFTGGGVFSDAVTLSDGLTIDQSANNVLTIAENSENIEVTFASNAATVSSTTGLAELNFTSIGVESEIVATHLERIRFCGNGSATGAADYMGPVVEHAADDMTIYQFGGSGCDGLNDPTEGTADAPWHAAFAFNPVAMVCVGLCTGASTANDAITYQLRDDTADVTGMACTATAWAGDATPSQCTVRDPTPATVAAGSAIAIKTIGTDDACADAGDDFECIVYVTF